MPSSMVHLLVAKHYNNSASIPFFIGNLAPDAVGVRLLKDKIHMRDINVDERLSALRKLSLENDISDDFIKGIILHLFVDYYWDIGPQKSYIEKYKGNNWFLDYRIEIGIVSAWLYHFNSNWAETLWDEMCNYEISFSETILGIKKSDIESLICRNNKWHRENNVLPSDFFTPELVESFSANSANAFVEWINN